VISAARIGRLDVRERGEDTAGLTSIAVDRIAIVAQLAQNTNAADSFGISVALSADGSTMAVGALFESGAARGINGDQADNSLPFAGAVYVFTRSGTTWTQQAYIKASNTWSNDVFGASIALSADGSTLAVGAPGEDSAVPGVDGEQTNDSA
jgi:hypothetical protein